MQKKFLFFGVAILCLLAAAWGYYLYQKPRSSVKGVSADYVLTAATLYQDFVRDEAAATKKYVDKVVEVKGIVLQMDSLENGINVLLGGVDAEGGVNCAFASINKKLIRGEQVSIKGKCAGFLMDVSLVDAVLTTE